MSIFDADKPVMSEEANKKSEWEQMQKGIEAEKSVLSNLFKKPDQTDSSENIKQDNIVEENEKSVSSDEKVDNGKVAELKKNFVKKPDLSFFPGLRPKNSSQQIVENPQNTNTLTPTQQAVSVLKQQNQEIIEQEQNQVQEENENLTPLFGGNKSNETFIHKPKEKQTRYITPNSSDQYENNVPKSLQVTKISEYLIMSGLLKSSFLMSVVMKEMNDSYFRDVSVRNIYIGFLDYYKTYQKLPNELELLNSIENNYINLGKTKEETLELAQSLLNMEVPDEDYLMLEIQKFIRQNNMLRTLSATLDKFREGESVNDESIITSLHDSLSVKIEQDKKLRLSHKEKFAETMIDALGTGENFVIPSSFMTLNNALACRGYQVGTVNLLVAPPSTGKTSLLINEGVRAAIQGHQVLHIFLGDMMNWDGLVRYTSCISGIPQRDLIMASSLPKLMQIVDEQGIEKNDIFDRIEVIAYPAGTVTVGDVIEMIRNSQKKENLHYDMVIIDYADNFARELKDNMYLEGGLVYDRLNAFAKDNKSVVLVATQPKVGYWSTEIMPMEAAGESSKKAQIVDLQLCFNKPGGNKQLSIGTIFVAKMRRGSSGDLIRVRTNWECCRIMEIDEETYRQECAELGIQPSEKK